MLTEEEHEEHHSWIRAKRAAEQEWIDIWRSIKKHVFISMAWGTISSILIALGYAIISFIKNTTQN